MGYMVHHAIVVSSWNDREIDLAWQKAREIFSPEQVTSLLGPAINGYWTFCVGPDGSKTGFPESDEGDRRRAEFVKWLESRAYGDGSSVLDWAEVQYGDDNGEERVVRAYNLRVR